MNNNAGYNIKNVFSENEEVGCESRITAHSLALIACRNT